MKPLELKFSHLDLAKLKKPLSAKDGSAGTVELTNVFQYLTAAERVKLLNEVYRVLKKGGTCQIATPHWCSNTAYGDIAVQWPPVAESFYFHTNKAWRDANKPVMKGWKCDFDPTWGYGMHPSIVSRVQEYQQTAVQFYKEAAQALIATLTKR